MTRLEMTLTALAIVLAISLAGSAAAEKSCAGPGRVRRLVSIRTR